MLGRTSLKREKMVVQEGMKISQYQLDIANYLLTDGNEVVTGWKLKWWWAKCLINLTVKNSLRKRTAQVTKPTAFASQRALLETQATLWALHLFVTRLQSSKDYNSPAIIQNTYTYYPIKICSTGWSLQMTKYKANKYSSKAHIICCPTDNKYCLVKAFFLFLKDMYVTKNY